MTTIPKRERASSSREEISQDQQQDWFDGYCARPDDWRFLIRYDEVTAGCVGYRIADGGADIYNVLRDEFLDHRSPAPALALDLITNFIAEA